MALAPNDMGGTERGTAMRLVTAHRSGDTAAFTEIVRTHYPTLLACARRRLANTQDAEDAVQEAFLRAYRRLETFGNHGDWRLGAWLNTILSNVCADILVRRRPTTPFDEWADGQADDRPDAVELVSDSVVHDAIARAIATLPLSQRSAFLLRMVDDRPYDEVAATLGITEDNARARVARARSKLQRSLSRSDALTGMLTAGPLLVAGSLRSALRRVFSSNAGNSAHATAAATLATNASSATAEAATVTSGPIGSSMQMLGQLASTPVAQVALAASTGGSARGSVVLGVVASLATASGLSVPAVAAVTTTTPPAVVQAAPHLTNATTPSSTANAATATASANGAQATAVSSTTPSHVATAPPAPSWVALAASAAVNGRAAVTSTPPPATTTPSSPAGTGTSTTTASTTGGSPATPPSTSPAAGSTSSASTPPAASTLPIGTCTGVAGFPGVTAPTSVPPLSSDTLVAVMSTAAHSLSSTAASPGFQTTGMMSPMSGSSAPVDVKVGTCLAAGGSILAVDMTGTTGAEVQLVGSLVSVPAASSTQSGSTGAVDYLFRGQVAQIAGKPLTGGRLPWSLSASFVAELQVQSGNTASIQVVFLRTLTGTTTASSSALVSTSGSATPSAAKESGTSTAAREQVTRISATQESTSTTGSTGGTTSVGPTLTS